MTLLAIRRDLQILSDLDGETRLRANDVLIMLAPPTKIAAITGLLQDSQKGGER